MKILRASHARVFCALLLGLFVVWDATMPKLTTGEQRGGWPTCDNAPDVDCAALEGEVCNSSCTECDAGNDGNCTVHATHCTCADADDGCASGLWNQMCN